MSNTHTGRPVSSFPMEFTWQEGDWVALFDKQVQFIQDELRRAKARDQVIVYLSCPISSRGGGHHATNVDIANFTGDRLKRLWGDRFFFLVPTRYQMESKEGTGLIRRHAELLGLEQGRKVDVDALLEASPPTGGDYMRMWTRVLVEDDQLSPDDPARGANLGGFFDGYYFLGPSDVAAFFDRSGAEDESSAIESYFASKCSMDPDFRQDFDADGMSKEEWEAKRKRFFRFYAARAGASFSKGCHDEWNILYLLNQLRLQHRAYQLGEQIAGFSDGSAIDPSAYDVRVTPGYETAAAGVVR